MEDSTSRSKKKRKISTGQEPKRPKRFSDFDKISKALLTAGYSSARRITISTRSSDGMNSATLSFSGKLLPSTKLIASANVPNYKSSMMKIQYLGFQKHAALAISVVLNRLPSVNLSATVDILSIAIGMKATYTTSGQFAAYDAGISVTKPNCDASIILADKGDIIRALYVHYFDQRSRGGFQRRKTILQLGGSWIMDDRTAIKAKLDNHGKLNALLVLKFKHKSHFTISGEGSSKKNRKAIAPSTAFLLQVKNQERRIEEQVLHITGKSGNMDMIGGFMNA
ncbi:mitochondrial outer membrane protein porin 2-like [Tripterygium wilfordii]|uniref:Mitochondrial outer membrane protein porin 2-like n=1 Tax=Tripterygium wilfordii TaxID=458696 RepID=A0A7J7CD96_TRIWF|nr:mitochondrial outer membrane protein porin 2-like [Tripterygium wilfordii]